MQQFVKIGGVNAHAATPSSISVDNIKANIQRGLPRLHHLPEFKKLKGNDKKVAIVGGGPSLKTYIDDIKGFKTIFAAGSTNDYLMSEGVIPTYTVVCDPDKISALYLTKTDTETKYLIASMCDDAVFKALEGKQIILWHCHSDDHAKELAEVEKDYEAVGGGCTVGMRSISIAMMMGYSNIHLFGFDSCVSVDNVTHAYNLVKEDLTETGAIFQIRLSKDLKEGIDSPGDNVYNCLGYQLAQAYHFKDFYAVYKQFFHPTFYGRGLLQDMMALNIEQGAI